MVVALAQRDEAVREQERLTGVALRSMTEQEGLVLRKAVTWCVEGLGLRGGGRLRQLAAQSDDVLAYHSDGERGSRRVAAVGAGTCKDTHGTGIVE